MGIKGVIFDFNGTMFPDGEYHEAAWRSYFASRTSRQLTERDFREHIHGVPKAQVIEYVLGRPATQRELDDVEPDREAVYRRLVAERADENSLAEGLPEFLDELERRGIPCTVATSSPAENVRFYFDKLGIGRWFSPDQVEYDRGTYPGKPNPDIFQHAAALMGLDASECAVFEDAPSGLEAARRAGAPVIVAVQAEFDGPYLQSLPGVTHTIADYRDLDGLLGMLGAV